MNKADNTNKDIMSFNQYTNNIIDPRQNQYNTPYDYNRLALQQNHDNFDYELINSNQDSYRIVERKQKRHINIIIIPIIIMVIFIAFIISIVKDINIEKVQTASVISSDVISYDKFKEHAKSYNLKLESKDLGNGANEIIATEPDMLYEIDMFCFSTNEEASTYFEYIKDSADSKYTSNSSEVTGQNCAEVTFISNEYNGFMDITYIENTIIVGIAYNSNEQKTVVKFMNELGY